MRPQRGSTRIEFALQWLTLWPRARAGLLESLIIAMQRTGHLDRTFEIPVAPPKASGMSQKRYTQILSQCRVEGYG